MNTPIFKLTQIQEDWQAVFAYQVFQMKHQEWISFRWGFNAGALLDEAVGRYKLFIESQAVNEVGFQTGSMQNNTLVLRGIHSPGVGLKMMLLGKARASTREQALQAAQQYAREVSSTFPYDFLLVPAKTEQAYNQLTGEHMLGGNSNIAQIQRGVFSVPTMHGSRYLTGIWQASVRANEQIWRALSAMPEPTVFNILIQPAILHDAERNSLLDIKKSVPNPEQNELISALIPWIEYYIKRRTAPWKRFFLVQIHLMVDGYMENLIRSVGSALTQDSNELASPGYQIRYPSSATESRQWSEKIRLLELTESSMRLDDIADVDEVFSVFRFPYSPPTGLPGANFVEQDDQSSST